MPRLRPTLRALLRIILGSALGSTLLLGTLVGWAVHEFRSDLPPNLDVLTDYRPLRASQIFSADGEMIGEFFVEKRVLVPIERLPDTVKKAFVAAEDARFYEHHGIDYMGILRAAWANLRRARWCRAGSSITQQVAKLLILGQERSLARKIREALLAFRIENRLSKDQILGIYLNHVYLGYGAYGVAAAANAYFGKSPSDLSVGEAAMLAALPKAPSRITPFHDFPRAQARQRYVLDQMAELRLPDTPPEAAAARREPLVLVTDRRTLTNVAAPYFVETVRRHVAERYGSEELLANGFRIHTTLDMRLQRAAEAAVRRGLEDLARRLGFAGPIARLTPEQQNAADPRPPAPAGPHRVLDRRRGAGGRAGPHAGAAGRADRHDPARRPPGRAHGPLRGRRGLGRQAAGRPRARPALFPTDPDTTYAAVVSAPRRR